MVTTSVREARLNLSKLLRLAEKGQEVVIKNRDRPVAKLVPYEAEKRAGFPDLKELRESLSKRKRRAPTVDEIVRDDRDARG